MKLKGYLYLAVTIILFSTLEVVSSPLKGLVDPLQLTFMRFAIGGLTLLPIILINKEKITRKDFLFLAGLGVLNIVISMGSLQLSISMGKASTAAILVSSNPIFVALFSVLLLKENFTINKAICIIMGIIGISLIVFKGGSGGDTVQSIFFGIFASITFGLYTVLGKLKSENISSLTMICVSALLGSIFYVPILLYKGMPLFCFPHGSVIRILYMGVFLSGIAYITYMKALKILTASKGSMVFFLKPVIASLLAVVFLNETIGINTIIGAALVLLGLSINFIKPRKAIE